jgi:tetratricopeptide (TPR) repeat protein
MRRVLPQATFSIFVACLVFAFPSCVRAQAAPASAGTVIDALQKGRYNDAVHMADELLRADPRSYKLWTLRAVGLERSSRDEEALASYQHALNIAPDYLPALEGAAQLNYKVQSAHAIPQLRRILSAEPQNTTAHGMLGVLEYLQANYAGAAQDFAAAEEMLASQPDALMAYAISLVHLNRISEAIARFQQLVALQPQNTAARYDLALYQWRSATATEALATLQPLLDAQSADCRVMRLAAAIHESNNETPLAIELLRAAMTADPKDAANYLDFATLAAAHGSFTVGADIVSIGIKQLPNSAPLYMARGVLYGQNGDTEKAMADFERAHALDPTNSMAASAEGIAQSQRHNHAAALENFKRQVREHPKDAFGHYLLAESLSWSPPDSKVDFRQNVGEAISEASKATQLDPHLVEAYDLLASLYLQDEQFDPAIKACRAALKLAAKDQQALYTLILALRKTNSKEELKGLVQTLTDLRKAEAIGNSAKTRYGELVENR